MKDTNEITIPQEKKLYTEEEVIEKILNHYISLYYPNPCPEGSDHDKNRDKIKKWWKQQNK